MSAFSVDFYRVDPSPSDGSFQDAVLGVSKIKLEDLARVKRVREVPLRMQDCQQASGLLGFDILKVRVDDPAEKGDLAGRTENIPFKKGEGIADKTACLFHPKTGVLLVQSNYYGPSASAIASYFEQHSPSVAFQLLPLITREGWQSIVGWNRYRAVEIQTAGFGDLPLDGQKLGMSVHEIASLSRNFGARKTNLRFSTGRDRQTTLTRVEDFVKTLFRVRDRQHVEVEKIIVSGRDGGDETKTIDLIKHRIRVQFPLDGKTCRHLEYSERHAYLLKAWGEKGEEARQASV